MAHLIKKKKESDSKTKRGRPKGSKNKLKIDTLKTKRGRGRPKGSKNKLKIEKKYPSKAEYVKQLESELLKNSQGSTFSNQKKSKSSSLHTTLEQIMFKIPCVPDPLIGTPKQVKEELNNLALKIQKRPNSLKNNFIFDKIHFYMHGYLINTVLKKFPFIKGYQTVDIYQETLIALRFKAIPDFKNDKKMSFLNFSKMCIRRHLITLLNGSRTIQKVQPINQAQSLDSSLNDEDNNGNTAISLLADKQDSVDKVFEKNESYETTRDNLISILSEFEQIVLYEYLKGSPYKEMSSDVSKKIHKRCDTKSIDNALLRIRKKATHLMQYSKLDDLPIFLGKLKNN